MKGFNYVATCDYSGIITDDVCKVNSKCGIRPAIWVSVKNDTN